MSQFSTQVSIDAPADDVFAFVTNFDNMNEYMPTLHKATPTGEGQIRMEGEAHGQHYDTTGWYQTHEHNRTMLWGAKGMNDYSGDLEVVDQGDTCRLTINLKYEALPDMSNEDREKLKAHEIRIGQDLDDAGLKVKTLCEKAAAGDKKLGYLI